MIPRSFLYFFVLFCFACSSPKTLVIPEEELITVTEYETLDTLTVTAPRVVDGNPVFELPVYNPAATQAFDLLHTALDIRFDWSKQHVLGVAELTLTPYFYDQQSLVLDAKVFDIHGISLASNDQALTYAYDDHQLNIQLDRQYRRGETVTIRIDYTAKPNEGPEGGSAAISSDRGLFFINPDGQEIGKPQQIWTQGETENSSRWFPTIDKPNERCTQDLRVTVERRFKTLSNGVLVHSEDLANGYRQDHWKLDIPHAPYLFMLAVGEFAVVQDRWQHIDVDYYVEEDYAPYARQIFDHTPEMLSFFSEYTGIPYPWPKYAQIVVRDFVSGAMENTTAVTFGEFVQKTDRQLIDNSNDYIVAHELIHHWFGDYVTCESWANLTLNEGFANYGEYLWFEYKYGADAADHHRLNELGGYLGSVASGGRHPLIHFGYEDKEHMFDAHSYNKGGLVLHMLRSHVGDAAFRAAFKKYLQDNALSAVEADELRMAFEDVTGKDLNWFFDQWFFDAGHPELEITYGYDADRRKATVRVQQIQDPESNAAIFQLPVDIDIYDDSGAAIRHAVRVDARSQLFEFDAPKAPALINFDARKTLLCEKQENKTDAQWAFQFQHAEHLWDRFEALNGIDKNPAFAHILIDALADPYYAIRRLAIRSIDLIAQDSVVDQIAEMAARDPRSEVRRAALKKFMAVEYGDAKSLALRVLEEERAYPVISQALRLLEMQDAEAALAYTDPLTNTEIAALAPALAGLYARTDNARYLPFFADRVGRISLYNLFDFHNHYFELLKNRPDDVIMDHVAGLKAIATTSKLSAFRRFAATNTIHKLLSFKKEGADEANPGSLIGTLTETFEAIKSQEKDERLRTRYEAF